MSPVSALHIGTRAGNVLFERLYPHRAEGEQLAWRSALREATGAAVTAARDDAEQLAFVGCAEGEREGCVHTTSPTNRRFERLEAAPRGGRLPAEPALQRGPSSLLRGARAFVPHEQLRPTAPAPSRAGRTPWCGAHRVTSWCTVVGRRTS